MNLLTTPGTCSNLLINLACNHLSNIQQSKPNLKNVHYSILIEETIFKHTTSVVIKTTMLKVMKIAEILTCLKFK